MTKRMLAIAAALALTACGAPLEGRVARGFVEVKDDPSYDFRAVAPEGVALAGRAVADPGSADVAFWERAVALRMREIDGYALLTTRDVPGPEGSTARELTFGHDEDGKPYLYRVELAVVKGKPDGIPANESLNSTFPVVMLDT